MRTRARTKSTRIWRIAFALPLLLLPVTPLPAAAADAGPSGGYGYDAYDQDDDPAMVPARIRALEGTVFVQRQREQDRNYATPNLPVAAGDDISTEQGRAEVELPDGSVLWLAEGTRIGFLGLGQLPAGSEDATVLALQSGTIEIEYRGGGGEATGDIRIDTPESSAYLLSPGRFRLESGRETTRLISLRGVAELAGDDGSVLVRSGQASRVLRGAVPDDPWAVNTLRLDDFDRWCDERFDTYLADTGYDDREYVEELPVTVRPYAAELDRYGDWQYQVQFGWVWRPTVYAVGWRPYTTGYWTWYPGGWTWVAYEPWGWAPYHYGRWHWVVSTGWVWIPGGVYSGAWVSWAVTPTYIGWCPLDYYNRPVYVNVNVTNVTVNRYGGGWNFLPLNRLGDRNATRVIVRPDRVPQLQSAVITRELPRFRPEHAAPRPDFGRRLYHEARTNPARLDAPAGGNRDGLVSFRRVDRREAALNRTSTGIRDRSRGTGDGRGGGSGGPGRNPEDRRDLRPRPRGTAGTMDPHATPAPGRDPGANRRSLGTSEERTPGRPAAVAPRPAPSGDPRVRPRPAPAETAARPRRVDPGKVESAAPRPPDDPSKRVFRRIFPPPARPGGSPPQQDGKAGSVGNDPRGKGNQEKAKPERARPRNSPAEAKKARPQPPRRNPPPPREKQEEKKDQP